MASSAERKSGLVTISINATPERLRSTSDIVACWSCSDLPASCSRCSRSMPTRTVSPSHMIDDDFALADDRRFVLADLVALRQIRIEIILAVEHRLQIDLGLQPEPGAHRLPHAFLVDHRQHAGHGGIDQRDVRIRLAAEGGRGAGEQFGLRGDLGMHFHADDDFPVAGRALDQLRFLVAPVRPSRSPGRPFRLRACPAHRKPPGSVGSCPALRGAEAWDVVLQLPGFRQCPVSRIVCAPITTTPGGFHETRCSRSLPSPSR